MYNQNSGYGSALINAVHAAVPTFGRIFIVMDADSIDEENYQKMQEVFKPYEGVVRFHTTLAAAYAACESNNNDVIVLDGSDSHPLTEMLTVAKNRVHFIGLDYLMGIKRRYGCASKISMGVTTAATDIAAILNTGVRNSFRGLKISSSNTVAESLYAFVDAGEYTYMENCEIFESGDLATATGADLVANGDSSMYVNCYIGSTAVATTANGARPCVLVSRETVTGKVARDVTFEGCIFAKKCGDTDNAMIYGSGATDVERLMYIKDCLFYNAALAAQSPDQAIEFDSAQTEGSVILKGCSAVNCTALSTTTGVFTTDPVATNDGGEAIQLA